MRATPARFFDIRQRPRQAGWLAPVRQPSELRSLAIGQKGCEAIADTVFLSQAASSQPG